MQTCPECGKTFDPADRATPPSPVKTYPHIQALLRRARWRASVRLHTRTADELAELTAYGWIGLLSAVRAGHRAPGYLYASAYRMMMREYTRQREHDALVFAAHIDLAALLLLVAIAVADADGPTIWKAHCPRHHTVTSVPDVDGDGVHILCTRAALEADR